MKRTVAIFLLALAATFWSVGASRAQTYYYTSVPYTSYYYQTPVYAYTPSVGGYYYSYPSTYYYSYSSPGYSSYYGGYPVYGSSPYYTNYWYSPPVTTYYYRPYRRWW